MGVFLTASNPTFSLSALAGRWIVFAAAPDAPAQAELVERLYALGERLDGQNLIAMAILIDPAPVLAARQETAGLRHVRNGDGAVAPQLGFGAAGGSSTPCCGSMQARRLTRRRRFSAGWTPCRRRPTMPAWGSRPPC